MRTFIYRDELLNGEVITLDSKESKHLFKTLRAKAGDVVEIMNCQGQHALGEVQQNKTLLLSDVVHEQEPKTKVHLFVAPPKKNSMDQMLKQLAEVGVWEVIPIITKRSVSTPHKDSTFARWETLLEEGCKQAKNYFLPKIHKPISFSAAVNLAVSQGLTNVYGATKCSKSNLAANLSNIAWFIGPEGGFTDEEEALMESSNFIAMKLGDTIMRVETAAVVGSAILRNQLMNLN